MKDVNSFPVQRHLADQNPAARHQGELLLDELHLVETALHMDKVVQMSLQMGHVFEKQFVSKYLPRVFPWALSYECGGTEYPKVFPNWEQLLQN